MNLPEKHDECDRCHAEPPVKDGLCGYCFAIDVTEG